MLSADKYFFVATHRAVQCSGLDEREIRNRLCAGKTKTLNERIWRTQPTSEQDDGQFLWTVTISEKMFHDGVKKMAYIVDAYPSRKNLSLPA